MMNIFKSIHVFQQRQESIYCYVEFGDLQTTLLDESRENDIVVFDDNMDCTW